jgi:hypothetical protein
VVFYAQGGSREVWGRKGAVQGSQVDPVDGPIAGLVEGDTFIQTPFSGGSSHTGFFEKKASDVGVADMAVGR